MNITEKEKEMIINIAENEYAPLNGGRPEKYEDVGSVWSDCLDCGPYNISSISIPGRISSLVKKELVETDGDIEDGATWLTQNGFTIYRSFNKE